MFWITIFGLPRMIMPLVLSSRTTFFTALRACFSDFAPVQGFVLTMAILYIVLNLLIDILYGVIDPRVRLEG